MNLLKKKKLIAEIITPTKEIIQIRIDASEPEFVYENKKYLISPSCILDLKNQKYIKYVQGNPKPLNPDNPNFIPKNITTEELNAISDRAIYSPFLPRDPTKIMFVIGIALITVLFMGSLYLLSTQSSKINKVAETNLQMIESNNLLSGWLYYDLVTPKPICPMLPCIPIYTNPMTGMCQANPLATYNPVQEQPLSITETPEVTDAATF